MAAVFYKGIITVNGSTGNQTVSGIVDENSASFTPTAIFLWSTYQTANGFSDGLFQGFGMTDATRIFSRTSACKDNVATSAERRDFSDSKIFLIKDDAGTILLDATLTSVGSGQFVINWTTVPGTGILVHYLAIGGSPTTGELINLDSVSFFAADPTHNSNMFGAMLVLPNATNAAGSNPSGVGWVAINSAGAWTQGVTDGRSQNAVNPSDTASTQLTDRMSAVLLNSGAYYNRAKWTPYGLYFINGGTGINYATLGLAGVVAKSGVVNVPTSNGTQAVTGVGFRPKALLIMSTGAANSASPTADYKLSFGGADATRQGWSYVGDVTGVTPTRTVGGSSDTKVVVTATPNATGSSTTKTSEASLQSLDADGFTLNWTTTDATAREYMYLALGAIPTASSGVGQANTIMGGGVRRSTLY